MRYATMAMLLMVAGMAIATGARAQDVPGIEICTAEKDMARRTGCLQSNVNFLKTTMTQMGLDQQRKLDAATRQIDALKAAVVALQKRVDELQAAQKKPEPAKDGKDAPKDAGNGAKK
jgi:phage host-nuclease inhibitor protein Gam